MDFAKGKNTVMKLRVNKEDNALSNTCTCR